MSRKKFKVSDISFNVILDGKNYVEYHIVNRGKIICKCWNLQYANVICSALNNIEAETQHTTEQVQN